MVDERPRADAPETVLVAEADVLVRMVVADCLRGCGYRVVEARSTDEALVILRDGAAGVDVVVCGLSVTGEIDAFGLAAWLAANHAGIDVVLAGSIPRAARVASDLCDERGDQPHRHEPQLVVDRIRRLRAARTARQRAHTG